MKKIINARALYQEPDKIWVAKGMNFFAIDYTGKRVSRKYSVGSLIEKLLGWNRLTRQLLRIGLHHLLPLNNGCFLVTAKKVTYIVDKNGEVVHKWKGYKGNKPAHQGVCLTPDGTIFFGEYLLNPNRDSDVLLYRSTDNGHTFQVVKKFSSGDIRHIHFIKWDIYENCLWMGTGDYGENNSECRLYRSEDNGEHWTLIGQGSQDWRAIGVCFTKDFLLWGTDAGSCPETSHFIRMNRKTHKIEVVSDLEGPCHGCASYSDGRTYFSTGVEGGENEKDNYSRLKSFERGALLTKWKLKKDIFPLVVQFGVMRFPLGSDSCNRVVFTTMGLKGYGENVVIE